ncbi:MAG: methyltransferase domain-containing protein [Flavobacteriales bacterium]|nr:methyltransferase domain-containing protein [Flavobacteriales bacterium]
MANKSLNSEWYRSWFNSKYYHVLYKSRDDSEAKQFISKLDKKYNFSKKSKILDLCCGKGRHSFNLHELGYENIWGIDLSPNNIKSAKSNDIPGIQFDIHDMREVYNLNFFDLTLNLFTSFGYFDDQENLEVLKSANTNLKQNGTLILDYFNPHRTEASLKSNENITIDGIEFNISRYKEKDLLIKEIIINDKNEHENYFEEVKIIELDKFKLFFKESGFELIDTFGEYNLSPYHEKSSNRMIMVVKKTKEI